MDTPPHVRPFGFVADRPVVRRLGDRPMFLGNRRAPEARSFAFVVSLTHDRQRATTHHHPLPDGPEATLESFAAAVETCRSLSRADGSVLVHCKAGVSRSCAVAMATLAAEENRSVRETLDVIHAARPTATPHPALHRLVVEYLAWTAPDHRAFE